MAHNRVVRGFAAVERWISPAVSVLVRMLRTEHNIHLHERQGTSTGVSLGLIHNVGHITPERSVQPTLRAAQPFDAHTDRSPAFLEGILVPFVDRLQVQRTTVPEVQARPQSHPQSLAQEPDR